MTKVKENILASLDELEQLIKAKFKALPSKSPELAKQVQLLQEKNKKAQDILEKVISELEILLTKGDLKCQE
jgi:hypothetical protein